MKKLFLLALPLALGACTPESTSGGDTTTTTTTSATVKTDEEYKTEAVDGMHAALLVDIQGMRAAAEKIQATIPTPADRGWDAKLDADAIEKSRAAWVEARTSYEHVEGALASLFPAIDTAIDARYDDFMTLLAADGGDQDLFDDQGVTGMHAIERILYADQIPQHVVDFEATLPGYVPAAFPADAAQAAEMKSKLCQKLIDDAKTLEEQWTPANIHVALAYHGLVALVTEQREKVNKASSFEEESRYSQRTMADLRDNLTGTRTAYAFFQPWILSKTDAKDPAKDGPTIDAKILKGLDALDTAYSKVNGDAIPAPPDTWSAESPSAADLETPFGQLYTVVQDAVDPALPDSVTAQMDLAAALLGFPQI
ncbi:MAG: imelysin family protein [Polyangiaceae bacterium]